MLIEVTLFVERLFALVALVLDSGMYVLVLDETGPLVEHFVALVAAELFRPGVNVDVLLVAAPVREGAATLLARVYSCLRVDVGVSRQVTLLVKHFPALLAFVLYLLGVYVHVPRQVAPRVLSASTDLTLKLLLPGVCVEVLGEVVLVVEYLLTYHTPVLLLLCVYVHVSLVAAVQIEGFAAHIAVVASRQDVHLYVSVEFAF